MHKHKSIVRLITAFLILVLSAHAELTEKFTFDGSLSGTERGYFFNSSGTVIYGPDENGVQDAAIVLDRSYHLRGQFNDRNVYGTGAPLANTLAITVRIDDIATRNQIVNPYESSGWDGYYLFSLETIPGTGELTLANRTSAPTHKAWSITGPAMEPGVWYRIVARWDQAAQTASLTVDGVSYDQITEDGIFANNPYTDGGAIYVGASYFRGNIHESFAGAISDLAFYDHSWSDEDVLADYLDYSGENNGCCPEHEARLSELETLVMQLSAQIDLLSADVDANAGGVTSLIDVVEMLGDDQADLTDQLVTIDVRLQTAESIIDPLPGEISALDAAVALHESNIVTLQDGQSLLFSSLGTLSDTVTGLQLDLSSQLTTLVGRIDILEGDLGTLSAGYTDLTQALDSTSNDLATFTLFANEALSALDNRLTVTSGTLSTLDGEYRSHVHNKGSGGRYTGLPEQN